MIYDLKLNIFMKTCRILMHINLKSETTETTKILRIRILDSFCTFLYHTTTKKEFCTTTGFSVLFSSKCFFGWYKINTK